MCELVTASPAEMAVRPLGALFWRGASSGQGTTPASPAGGARPEQVVKRLVARCAARTVTLATLRKPRLLCSVLTARRSRVGGRSAQAASATEAAAAEGAPCERRVGCRVLDAGARGDSTDPVP